MSNWLMGKVIKNQRLNDDLTSLIIDAPSLPDFEAGQFVRIGLYDGDEVLARPYSLINTPQEPFLEIYFNMVAQGPLSPRLFTLAPGDEVLVADNPSGFLTVSEVPACRHLWMIATGTGIGPFLAILKNDLVWTKFEKTILCYSVSRADELAYQDLIAGIGERRGPQFVYTPIVTREPYPGGLGERVSTLLRNGDLERFTDTSINADDSHVLLCGSANMITDVSEELSNRDMRRHRRRDPGHITTEKYH